MADASNLGSLADVKSDQLQPDFIGSLTKTDTPTEINGIVNSMHGGGAVDDLGFDVFDSSANASLHGYDSEDRGLTSFDDIRPRHAFQPRLAFIDSDENLINNGNNNHDLFALDTPIKQERSVSDSAVVPSKGCDGRAPPNTLTLSQHSHISQLSSDSDLITDHSSPTNIVSEDNQNENNYLEIGGFENHLCQAEESHDLANWHCHSQGLRIPPDKMARNQLIAVSVLCFIFMIGETIGGALSNSLALYTDVLHLGSDLISFLISLLSIYLAKKPATRKMSFGYHRAEVLGALISVFIIWAVTGVLIYVAIERIVHEHYKDVKADEMLVTASLGVVFNIVMGIVLHSEVCCAKGGMHVGFGHGHSHGGGSSSHSHNSRTQTSPGHGHGHSHGHGEDGRTPLLQDADIGLQDGSCVVNYEIEDLEPPTKPHPKNINVRAAFIHVIGDIIQSLGVLLAAIIIKLKPEEKYRLADPICTFLFSVLVLFTTINVLRDTLRIILEGVPVDTDYYSIKTSLQKIPGVKAVHGLTVWCLTLEKNALAVHLAVDPKCSYQKVLAQATDMIRKNHNIIHMTIQVEDYKPNITAKCTDCQELKK